MIILEPVASWQLYMRRLCRGRSCLDGISLISHLSYVLELSVAKLGAHCPSTSSTMLLRMNASKSTRGIIGMFGMFINQKSTFGEESVCLSKSKRLSMFLVEPITGGCFKARNRKEELHKVCTSDLKKVAGTLSIYWT